MKKSILLLTLLILPLISADQTDCFIKVTGKVTYPDNTPAPNANITIICQGLFKKIQRTTQTDLNGNYKKIFLPHQCLQKKEIQVIAQKENAFGFNQQALSGFHANINITLNELKAVPTVPEFSKATILLTSILAITTLFFLNKK